MGETNRVKRRNRHAGNEKKSGLFKMIVIGIIISVFVIAIGFILWYNISLSNTGTSEEGVSLEIPLGSGVNRIASILKEADLIKSKNAFKLYVKLNNVTDFQAGNYNLTKDMNVEEIVQALQKGIVFKDTNINITFVEGKTFRYIAKQIAENTNNTEEDVYALVKNEEYIDSLIDKYWFLTDEIKDPNIYYPLEGYLFPETYSFEDKDVSVEEIFKKLLDQMEKELENYREEIEQSEYTVHELLSIASIIENEVIFDKDRKDVSSVIYNRLRVHMSIGSDVTTYYAFKVELGSRDLYNSEINAYNPYNTRGPGMNSKLPVGPISNVGRASIKAAIEPNDTDYLFFVADATGNVYFTKTNAEHEKVINNLKANNAWAEF